MRTGQRDKQIDVFIHGRAEVGMDVAINRSRLDLAGLVCRDTLIFTFVKIKKIHTPDVVCSLLQYEIWMQATGLVQIIQAFGYIYSL